MVFVDVLFDAYGIRKANKSAMRRSLGDASGDICAKAGLDAKECERRLIKGQSVGEDSDVDGDTYRFLEQHLDLLRKTRVDTTVSRMQMILSIGKAIPAWMWFIILSVGFCILLVAILPMLVILVEVLTSPLARGKVFVVCAFAIAILLAYFMLPV